MLEGCTTILPVFSYSSLYSLSSILSSETPLPGTLPDPIGSQYIVKLFFLISFVALPLGSFPEANMYLSNIPPAIDAGDVIFRESLLNTSSLSRSAWAKSLFGAADKGPLGSF